MKKTDRQIKHSGGYSPHQEMEQGMNRWVGGLRSIDEAPEDSSITVDIDQMADLKKDFTDQGVHQTEERFRTLIENSTDGILMCSPDGTLLYASPSISRLFDYEIDKLVGVKGLEFVHPDEQESIALLWADLVKTSGKTVRVEVRYPHKDGSWHWMEAVSTNLLHEPSIRAVVVNFRDITERKMADELVHKAERQYKELVASIESIVWEADAKTLQFSFVSKQAERLLGYPVEQWCDEPDFWKNHLHPDDREEAIDACLKGVMEKSGHDLEYRMVASDGQIVWLRDLVRVVLENGEAVKLRGIMMNITQKKQADLLRTSLYQIAEKEGTTANILDFYAAIHAIISHLILAKNFYIAIHDFSADELRFDYWVDEFDPHPQPRKLGRGLTEYVLRSGKPLLVSSGAFEELVRKGEIELIGTPPIDWIGVPLKAADKVLGVIVAQSYTESVRYGLREKEVLTFVAQHISSALARIQGRKALDLQISYFKQLFENSPAGIVILDGKNIIVNANKAFEKIFQYSVEEIRGQDIRDFIVPQSYREEADEIRTAAHRRVSQKETLRKRKNGSLVHVSIMGYPIIMDNEIVGVFEIYFDVTERKRLEEHLREAQKMESIGTLTGGIAHDFNNILQVIYAHVAMLKQFHDHPRKFARSVAILKMMTLRARALVKQLLTFARKSEVTMESVQVNEIMHDFMKLMAETFPKTIVISSQLQQNLSMITGDANQLHQALLNLCVNARDAMPKGGTIYLVTEIVQGKLLRTTYPNANSIEYVHLGISDTGIGMDKATRVRIFEPFFTTKKRDKGTGLGLAVVYGIVKNHNGFIDVESDIGRGTTFHIYFPAQQQSPRSVKKMGRAQKKVAGGTETILLIEDEEHVRDWVTSILVEKGYAVLAAADGLEAIDLYCRHRSEIALVLLDVGLPKLGGEEVFLRLREIDSELKVIFASGYVEPGVKARILKAGAKAFMEKPYAQYEVLKKIRDVLDAPLILNEV